MTYLFGAGASANCLPNLSFAWEKNGSKDTVEFLDNAERSVIGTQVLVIVGYSFPFFNREIDRRMLSKMGIDLEKIYV